MTDLLTTQEMKEHLVSRVGAFPFTQYDSIFGITGIYKMIGHECDLLVLTKSNVLQEVEIKISISDLKADSKKEHKHKSDYIKYLYFAIPDYLLQSAIDLIPSDAGIITVCRNKYKPCNFVRRPKTR